MIIPTLKTTLRGWLLTLAACSAASIPRSEGCTNPPVRKEWRTLTGAEQLEYIRAVKCLQELPAKSTGTTPGAVSRFDDFVAVHIKQADYIHFVGHTHPWHRYLLGAYEKALIDECHYTGGQPYWDWTKDSSTQDAFLASPIFDPIYGFGGNGHWIAESVNAYPPAPGRTGGGCVTDGPFKDQVLHLGPNHNVERNDRCLTRDFSPWIATTFLSKDLTDETMRQKDFGWFDLKAQGILTAIHLYRYHGGGHLAIGGELGALANVWSSPNDPLFYLFHGEMDHLWWKWQKANLKDRLYDISGPIVPFDFPFGNKSELSRGNITLAWPIHLNEVAPEVPTSELMDIMGGTLCYDYEDNDDHE